MLTTSLFTYYINLSILDFYIFFVSYIIQILFNYKIYNRIYGSGVNLNMFFYSDDWLTQIVFKNNTKINMFIYKHLIYNKYWEYASIRSIFFNVNWYWIIFCYYFGWMGNFLFCLFFLEDSSIYLGIRSII